MSSSCAPRLISGTEPPVQARSRRTYDRLLDAAAEALAERPFDEITVEEIAGRAGYTKGAFYHRFEGKRELLRHLVARLTEGALEAWEEFLAPEAWDGGPVEAFLEAFVHRVVAIYGRSPHLMRAFVRASDPGGDEAVRATGRELNRRVMEGFLAVLRHHEDELAPEAREDLPEAARFWLTALTGLLHRTYLEPTVPLAPDPDPEAVEERALRLLVPYLAG